MAVSCPEVMYGAYYPYLYGRGAARSFHHAPHFQYDRFNVQSGASNPGSEAYSGGGGGGGGAAGALSSGSASSGAQSPGSPPHAHHAHHAPRLRTKEEDLSTHGRASADGGGSSESEGECGGGGGGGGGGGRARAQYVSANCVVFTHYSGDVAAVVDEHFTRALSIDKPKESVPMVSRNLPASFFNAAAAAGVAAAGGACAGVDIYDYDPWHQHYPGYGHAAHRHAAEYHAAAQAHHNMAAAAGYGVGGLLLGRGSLHHQYKPVDWHAQHHAALDPAHAHAHAAHAHAAHATHPAACSPYSYPAVPGLEAQVQDTSKDLYWF
ncbi:protein vestigial isoform X2 [Achroia grisella]|uniref:protein vestigial isoform X2 n=1 Tax=Achroia grisella TaxID=688607 RepID=UPI0027D2D8F9|nr:protein vestigial isoform X2 [Achroia grisella]